jgi:purine nucleoside phosphorylase
VTLAVIGGTGFGAFAGLTETKDHAIETDFGPAEIQSGRLQGQALLFLPRHGMPARFLTRASITATVQALKKTTKKQHAGFAKSGNVRTIWA